MDFVSVPIVFASNDYFIPYMATMILSVALTGRSDKQYRIFVLHKDISQSNQQRLQDMLSGYQNVDIHFMDMTPVLKGCAFYTGNKDDFSEEAYYRLLIPYIFPSDAKAIYLDGDMLALTDVSALYDMDLSGKLIAAVRDYSGNAEYCKSGSGRKQYRDRALALNRPMDYFISGTLVMNLESFREVFTLEYILKLATEHDWYQHDQDILNVLCNGKTRILDSAWNATEDYGANRYLPKSYYDEWRDGWEHPNIIHFAGSHKPWLQLDTPYSDVFWKIAVQTPFLPTILDRMSKRLVTERQCKEKVIEQSRNGQIGFRWILECMRGWAKYKLRKRGRRNRRSHPNDCARPDTL